MGNQARTGRAVGGRGGARRKSAALVALVALSALAQPGAARAASLTLAPDAVLLGRTESVEVTLRVPEPPGTEASPLRLSVNVGAFGPVERLEAGVYRSTYTPPATRFPQVALVAAWRETDAQAPIDFLRIPLLGASRIDTIAPPGSEVRVVVGASEFGPVAVDARGRASVPVDVPPGVPEARILIKERSGFVLERSAAVSVPPYNRLTVAVVPHAVLADGQDWARLEVHYDTAALVPAERIALVASEGTATLVRTEPGRYVYRYVAPAGSLSHEVRFTVGVEGDPAAQGSASLGLGVPPAAEVAITVPGKPLVCDGRDRAPVQVRVWDDKRLGLPLQRPEVMANGRLVEDVAYRGGGLYEASLVAPSAYPEGGLVRLSATVVRPDGRAVGASASYRVLPAPLPAALASQVTPQPLAADGTSQALIALDLKDKAGLPLEGARLVALASHGTVGAVQELGGGRYRVDYASPGTLPPGGEALVRIVDSSNAFESVIPVSLRQERHLLVGLRGGYVHGLRDQHGPRGGLDFLVPLRVGPAALAVQATVELGGAGQTVGTSRSTALFVPATLRLSWAPVVTRRLSVHVGAGVVAAWARVENDLAGYAATQAGIGAMGFVSGELALGPGEAFLEVGWAWCPVEHPDFSLDAGGLGLQLGYRFGLF